VLEILDAVNSPSVKACIDLQNLQKGEDPRQAVLDAGARQLHVHYGGEFRKTPDERLECFMMNADFPAYIKALIEINYQGFLSFEFCHRCVQRDKDGSKLSEELAGIERVHEQVQLARDFMLQTIADAKAALKPKTS
jgi:sugar phosphate isomerase/epimerase